MSETASQGDSAANKAMPVDLIKTVPSKSTKQSSHHDGWDRLESGAESSRTNAHSRIMLKKKYGMSEDTTLVENSKKTGDDPSNRHIAAATGRLSRVRNTRYAKISPSVVNTPIVRTSAAWPYPTILAIVAIKYGNPGGNIVSGL
jgi:PAB1-binding protein PBP1